MMDDVPAPASTTSSLYSYKIISTIHHSNNQGTTTRGRERRLTGPLRRIKHCLEHIIRDHLPHYSCLVVCGQRAVSSPAPTDAQSGYSETSPFADTASTISLLSTEECIRNHFYNRCKMLQISHRT
ncbi:hypothetical protein PNOK_0092300 [Pyrrhoderma noxium]|uniref:Uncharacterized protein n=1 Tax=Pyrrhoderma noxium TaxID=2282107 RepID=A0A286UWM4_9AGAM|nr:hypothetical protein PNOK_0092300 [Pyrrhoderma noxium]